MPANAEGLEAGDAVTLGVRPRALSATARNLVGEVGLVERLGNETTVSLRLPSGTSWLAVLDRDHQLAIGQHLPLTFDSQLAAVFDADGTARYLA